MTQPIPGTTLVSLEFQLDAGIGTTNPVNLTGFTEDSSVCFNVTRTSTLVSYPLGAVGPLDNFAIGYPGTAPGGGDDDTNMATSVVLITEKWQWPDGDASGAHGAGYVLTIVEVGGVAPTIQEPPETYGTYTTGSGQYPGDTFTTMNNGTVTVTRSDSTGVYGNATIVTPSGTQTWLGVKFDAARSDYGLRLVKAANSIANTLWTIDITGGPVETLALNSVSPTAGLPLELSGSNAFITAGTLALSIDGGSFTVLSEFTPGNSWTAIGPDAAYGVHTLQVQDAVNTQVVSNIVTYTLEGLELNQVTATANVAPPISGIDYEVTPATALQYQMQGQGAWETVSNFTPATSLGGTWYGDGPAEPNGIYVMQVRDSNRPTITSNYIEYQIGQGGQTLEDYPVWSVQPDWSDGMTERLEWLTDVLRSTSGAEQRIQIRVSPRRTFEMKTVVFGPERALYDLGLKAQGTADWYVPLWYDVSRIGAAVSSGGTVISFPTAGHEFSAGSIAILYQTPFSYELCQVTALSSNAVTLASALQNNWPVNTRVMPIMRASTTEEPKATRQGDNALIVTVGWQSKTANDYTSSDSAAGTDTYQSFPVLTVAPDETVDMNYEFQRILDTLDPTIGLRLVADTAGYGFGSQQYNWFTQGYPALNLLRQFLYALAGKLNLVWVPTFYEDLVLKQDIASSDGTIIVQQCGYTLFGGSALQGRQNIRIEKYDGTSLYTTITGSAAYGAEEILAVGALGASVPMSAVKRVSFMVLCRQDTDAIEIQHEQAGGVCTVATIFREAPNLRTDPDA
jgi:hypothetical protein